MSNITGFDFFSKHVLSSFASFESIAKIISISASVGFLILLRYCIFIGYFPSCTAQDLTFLLPALAILGFVFYLAFVLLVYLPTITLNPYLKKIKFHTVDETSSLNVVDVGDQGNGEGAMVLLNLKIYGVHIGATLVCEWLYFWWSQPNFSANVAILLLIFTTILLAVLAAYFRLKIGSTSKEDIAKSSRYRVKSVRKQYSDVPSSAKLEDFVSVGLGYLASLFLNGMILIAMFSIKNTSQMGMALVSVALFSIVMSAIISGASSQRLQGLAFAGISIMTVILIFVPPNVSISCMRYLGIGAISDVSLVTDETGSQSTSPVFRTSRMKDKFFVSNVYVELNIGVRLVISDRRSPLETPTHTIEMYNSNVLSMIHSTDANDFDVTLVIAADDHGNARLGVIIPNSNFALFGDNTNLIQLRNIEGNPYMTFKILRPEYVHFDTDISSSPSSTFGLLCKYFDIDRGYDNKGQEHYDRLVIKERTPFMKAVVSFKKENERDIKVISSYLPESLK